MLEGQVIEPLCSKSDSGPRKEAGHAGRGDGKLAVGWGTRGLEAVPAIDLCGKWDLVSRQLSAAAQRDRREMGELHSLWHMEDYSAYFTARVGEGHA